MRQCALFRVLVVLLFLLSAHTFFGQDLPDTGVPPFASLGGGPFDQVNLQDLNVHFGLGFSQRTVRSMSIESSVAYDSSIWFPQVVNGVLQWRNVDGWGWTTSLGTKEFGRGLTYVVGKCQSTQPNYVGYYYTLSNFVYYDGNSTPHRFAGTLNQCTGPTDIDSTTTDGSGYRIRAHYDLGNFKLFENLPAVTIYTRSGSSISFPSCPPDPEEYCPTTGLEVPTGMTDSNGNYVPATTTYVSPGYTLAGSYNYTAPGGVVKSVQVTFVGATVRTNFGVPGIAESPSTSVSLPHTITFPDGSTYMFDYEPTPGIPGAVTGRIAKVTLPTGGTITYSYNGGSNGIFSDGSTAGIIRTVSDGITNSQTTYSSNGSGETTVTDALQNTTIIDFSNKFETQRRIYAGAASPSTLKESIVTCYNGNTDPSTCASAGVVLPINQRTVFTTLEHGLQSKVDAQFSNTGLLKQNDIYDFATNGNPPLLQREVIGYDNALVENVNGVGVQIYDRPTSILIEDGAGNPFAQTTIINDEAAYCCSISSNLPSSLYPPTHFPVSGSRGNPTTIQQATGNGLLIKHITYDDAGTIHSITDANQKVTTLNYGTDWTTNCLDTFPTSVSLPPVNGITLTSSSTWDCNGTAATSSTDANGQTTSITAWDPNFWRPAKILDETKNVTTLSYGLQQSEAVTTASDGTSILADVGVTLDPLGRARLTQERQGPIQTASQTGISPNAPLSSFFNTVESDYDILGRPHRQTNAYVTIGANLNPNAPATITSYDVLGRASTVTDPAGGVASFDYYDNDVLLTLKEVSGTPPAGEHDKQRQYEYDGAGRLSSVCEIVTMPTSLPSVGSCGQTRKETGYWTRYQYDPAGRLTAICQNTSVPLGQDCLQNASAGQQTRTFSYDQLGRLLSESNPETGTVSYSYDSSSLCGNSTPGDLASRTDPTGNTACYSYDDLHRLTTVTHLNQPGGKVLVYDQATINGVTLSNSLGRLVRAYTTGGPVTMGPQPTSPSTAFITDLLFSYSPRGAVTDVYESTPNSGGYYHITQTDSPLVSTLSGLPGLPPISYHGSGGLITQVTAGSDIFPLAAVTYNNTDPSQPPYQPVQALTGIRYESGDFDSFGYDPNSGLLTQYTFHVNGNTMNAVLSWNQNETAHALQWVNSSGTDAGCGYTYDDLSRMQGVNCSIIQTSGPSSTAPAGGWSQTLSYDSFNNITKSGSTSFQPSYDTATNHFSLPGKTIHWDANGNPDSDGVHSYTWNSDGSLANVDNTKVIYDALGRAVELQRNSDATCGTPSDCTQIVYAPGGGKLALMQRQSLQRAMIPLPGGATAVYGPVNSATPPAIGILYFQHPDWLGSARLASTLGTFVPASAGAGSATVSGTEQSHTTPGTQAAGSITVNGSEQAVQVSSDPSGGACDPVCGGGYVTVYDSGTLTLTIGGYTTNIGYGRSSDANGIAYWLAQQLNSAGSSPVTALVSGATIYLTSKAATSAANDSLSWSVSYDTNDFTQASFSIAPSGATLTGGNDPVTTFDSGTVWITVNGTKYPVRYGQSDSTATVLSRLQTTVASAPVTASTSGAALNLAAATTGSNTNYPLAAGSVSDRPDLFATPSFTASASGASLTGGGDNRFVNTAIMGEFSYAPFGETFTNSNPSAASFTGQNQDTVPGLYDFLYREYSPSMGRWISPDPMGIDAGDLGNPQTFNLYAYVNNSPTDSIDIDGLDACEGYGLFCYSGGGGGGGGGGGFGGPFNAGPWGQTGGFGGGWGGWFTPGFNLGGGGTGGHAASTPPPAPVYGGMPLPNGDVAVGMQIFTNNPQCPTCGNTWQATGQVGTVKFAAEWYWWSFQAATLPSLARNIWQLGAFGRFGGRVLYSGWGARAAAESSEAVASGASRILGQTPAGRVMTFVQGQVEQRLAGNPEVQALAKQGVTKGWEFLSESFAAGARGEIEAYTNLPAPQTIFLRFEQPAVLANPNAWLAFRDVLGVAYPYLTH
jgi:RHS repeat-associated protein